MSFDSNLVAGFFFLSCVLGIPLIVVTLMNKLKRKRKKSRPIHSDRDGLL